jgi:hypothetical protein
MKEEWKLQVLVKCSNECLRVPCSTYREHQTRFALFIVISLVEMMCSVKLLVRDLNLTLNDLNIRRCRKLK